MPSSSSGSFSESSSSHAPAKKRRQVNAESPDGSDDDRDVSDSEANSAGGEDSESDAPQPLSSIETTVLSHAERRRQKKRQKQQPAAASVASPRKKRKLGDGSADAATTSETKAKTAQNPRWPRRQNSVWVGNLSFRTTQDALRAFFDGVGTITRLHMPVRRGNREHGENMGFAYVDFDTPDAKVIAITLSEGQLDGRKLLIKDGVDFTGRPARAKTEHLEGTNGGEGKEAVRSSTTEQGKGLSKTAQKVLRMQKQPPAPTLFLGNLGFETTEESIRELFEAHRNWRHKGRGKGADAGGEEGEALGGEGAAPKDVWIRKVRMGTFEDSGHCKGFAFVDFTGIDHATEALVNPRNHRLNGRDLVVEYASPDAVRRAGGPRHPKGDQGQESKNGGWNAQQKDFLSAPYTKQRRPRHTEQEDKTGVAEVLAEAVTRPRRPGRTGHDRSHARRVRPGAALAHAQRQSAAILPSQGQKIVF